MNINKLGSLIAISGILAISACDNKSEKTNAATDSRFTGKKFSEHIRSTEARTPEDERAGFLLPDGFEIELYASEPDIGKPMNIAFDAKGRMWVTQSFEYPFPATFGKGSDRITILEDTDGDGKADKFTRLSSYSFLNFISVESIPTGNSIFSTNPKPCADRAHEPLDL